MWYANVEAGMAAMDQIGHVDRHCPNGGHSHRDLLDYVSHDRDPVQIAR
jgi:hypothetical protein